MQYQVVYIYVNLSGRVETSDNELVRRLPESPPARVNVTYSAPDGIVNSGSIVDLEHGLNF